MNTDKKVNTTVIAGVITLIILGILFIPSFYSDYQKKLAIQRYQKSIKFQTNLEITIAKDLKEIVNKNRSKKYYRLNITSSRNPNIKYQIEYSNRAYFQIQGRKIYSNGNRALLRVDNCNISCKNNYKYLLHVFIDYSQIDMPSYIKDDLKKNNKKLEYLVEHYITTELAPTTRTTYIGLSRDSLSTKASRLINVKYNNTSLDPCSSSGDPQDGKFTIYNLILKNKIQ